MRPTPICKVCNKPFTPSGRKETCSPKCRRIVKTKSQERYRKKNKKEINRKQAIYYKGYLKRNEIAAMAHRYRRLLNHALKGNIKTSSTEEYLGCSFEEFKQHLESKFIEGMSWDNRPEWHIDHIIPISSAKNIEEAQKLSHYTNLRPLWASDNISKGKKELDDQSDV